MESEEATTSYLPHLDHLPPYDAAKRGIAVEVMTRNGLIGTAAVNREPQRGILTIDYQEFARLIGLPDDHVIERITIAEAPLAPGLLISIEGPGCHVYPEGAPLYYERLSTFLGRVDEARKHAMKHWLTEATKLQQGAPPRD